MRIGEGVPAELTDANIEKKRYFLVHFSILFILGVFELYFKDSITIQIFSFIGALIALVMVPPDQELKTTIIRKIRGKKSFTMDSILVHEKKRKPLSTMPAPKPCPKCGGTLHWIIIQSVPGYIKLKGNEHLFRIGFSCQGKYGFMSGCGYFEDHSPKKKNNL